MILSLLADKEKMIVFLQSIELFKHIEKSALKSLTSNLEPIYLKGNQILIHEGDLDNDLFVVVLGRLRIYKNINTDQEEILAEIGVGEIAGEVAILADKPRTATAKAIRDTVLVKLSKKHYEAFLEKEPQAGLSIAKACIERLLNAQKKEKTSKNVSTVTFVPLGEKNASSALIDLLIKKLEKKSTTLLITRESVENIVGDINNIFQDGEKLEKLLRFINDQEQSYRDVIYKADSSQTAWTELCNRQADLIYMILDEQTERIHPHEINSGRVGLILHHKTTQDRFTLAQGWIRQHKIKDYFHVHAGNNVNDINRIVRVITGESIGLVLSGGGARGFAHIGVLRALEERKIPIDIIGGTSSGSLIAGAHAIGVDSHEMKKLCRHFALAGSHLNLTFPYISISTGKSLVKTLKDIFGEKLIEELDTRLFCVSANITKNNMFIHDEGLVWKAIRASISLPGIYPPVFHEGDSLVDGAVINNLPVDVMNKHFNAGKVIASLILTSAHKFKSTAEADVLSGWKLLFNKLNPFMLKKIRVPRIHTVIMRSMNLNELSRQMAQAQEADFAFLLNLEKYGLMQFKKYQQIIESGYHQAIQMLDNPDVEGL
jgi:predicted acylesterase/phospholipase RssA/CRP-like cAMP-binding protein